MSELHVFDHPLIQHKLSILRAMRRPATFLWKRLRSKRLLPRQR